MKTIPFRSLIALTILVGLSVLPWIFATTNQPVPSELLAQPTAYQLRRQEQQTATALAEANAAPTLAATAFDMFAQPETTPEVLPTETPHPS